MIAYMFFNLMFFSLGWYDHVSMSTRAICSFVVSLVCCCMMWSIREEVFNGRYSAHLKTKNAFGKTVSILLWLDAIPIQLLIIVAQKAAKGYSLLTTKRVRVVNQPPKRGVKNKYQEIEEFLEKYNPKSSSNVYGASGGKAEKFSNTELRRILAKWESV